MNASASGRLPCALSNPVLPLERIGAIVSPILVVDDDESIRDTLRCLLEDEGYLVHQAPNGQIGLERLRDSEHGLVVLLDYSMPIMDGFAVLRTVADDAGLMARHRFVLITAHSTLLPPEMRNLLADLDVPVCAKPFSIDTILDAVEQAMGALVRSA